ncbi:MAG TPA: hypothetical protein VGR06_18905 [Actinophytocola sp.]|uniref:hypothetical protein n=1 Tax=Actinophytocola sp. TaxID=1872138 RepID=UPI002E0AEB03|nr:hypothetical protein [Actinophytocola sp.]
MSAATTRLRRRETSARARTAHERFRNAVDQSNAIVSALSDAQDALATGCADHN